MSFLNVIFLKKLLFSSAALGLSSVPVILLNKRGLFPEGYLDDRIRRAISNPSEFYAQGLSQNDLISETLSSEEMRFPLEEIFAKDIALKFFSSSKSSYASEKYREFLKQEKGEYGKLKPESGGKKALQKVFDSRGGSRSDMERRYLSDKSYEALKDEILNFGKRHFLLKRDLTEGERNEKMNPFSLTLDEVNNPSNWPKIGFHHLEEDEHTRSEDLKDFFQEKFNFINWAYRRWYDEAKPFYVWMSLWKHKEGAPASELEVLYNKETLGDSFPSAASYEFPLFPNYDSNIISSHTKFRSFFRDIVNGNSMDKDLFVPRGYTDDNSTAIFVEGNNMYKNLYIKFAAVSNFLQLRELRKISGSSSQHSSSTNGMAKRQKSENVNNYTQPHELFLFGDDEDKNFSTIKLKENLIKVPSNKNNLADAVEIEGTPWIFIRNIAGIHAVAVDSHGLSKHKTEPLKHEDFFHHFNYRNLQLIHGESLGIEKTVQVSSDSFFNSFRDHMTKNLPSLLLTYLFQKTTNTNKLFGETVDPQILSYKNLHKAHQEFEEIKRKHLWRMEMRSAILSEYSKDDWELDKNQFKNASPKFGLTGPLPYPINTSEPSTEEDFILFRDLEEFYDFPKSEKKTIKKYLQTLSQNPISTEISKYMRNLNLQMSPVTLESSRVFTTNFFINCLMDSLLSKPKLFNQLLHKLYLSRDYRGKFLSKNVVSKPFIEDDLRIIVPEEYRKNLSDNDEKFTDFTPIDDSSTADDVKNMFGFLNDSLKKHYYPTLFLKKTDRNPWDILRYGVWIADSSKISQLGDNLLESSTSLFEQNYQLNIGDIRSDHFNFLTALIFLTKNKFEGFRKVMSSRINPFSNSWWLMNKTTLTAEPSPEASFLSNPYLKTSTDTSLKQKKVSNWSDFLRSKFSEGQLGLYIYGSPKDSRAHVPSDSSAKFILNNLYKFGDSSEKMAEFVDKISGESDLERVIGEIKETVKADTTESNSNWLSFLDLKQIYVKESDENKIYRSLTLRERQNLIVALLKKVNVPIENGEIEKSNYKSVFLADPDNNYNLTREKHTPGSETKIKDEHFSSDEKDISIDSSTTYTSQPINSLSFSSPEELQNLAKRTRKKSFWSWIISFSQMQEIQELALRDLQNNSDKIEPYDSKWREMLDSKFLK